MYFLASTDSSKTTTIGIVISPPQFLGLSLDTAEAETAMYSLFGITIAFFVVLLLVGGYCSVCSKMYTKSSSICQ